MNGLFNPDLYLWRMLARFADLLGLSLLWTVLCIPLFPIGAATTALYDAVSHCVYGNEAHTYRRFFQTLRREFLPATVSTVVWGAVGLLLIGGYNVLYASAEAGALPVPALIAYLVIAIIPVGTMCWLGPLLSRFTFSVTGLSWTALQFSFAHLPSTVAVVIIAFLAVQVCGRFIILLIIVPGLTALLWCPFMERAFRKHLPPQEEGEHTQEEQSEP